MKHSLIIMSLALGSLLVACRNTPRRQANKTAEAIQEAVAGYGPGKVAATDDGYSMKAVIDGKTWTAKSMMEINASNENFISGDDGKTQISFYMDRDHITLNKPHKLYTGHSADLAMGDKLMSAKSGELTITKADKNVIEGTFHFSATSVVTGDKAEVTGGAFRVLLNK